MTLLLISSLVCSTPVMQNVTKFPWNKYDMSILKQAKKRCGELYPSARYVRLFRKFGFQDYSVICGVCK
jgi:hypothetical protein